MVLTLDKEQFSETVERFIREAEARIDDYTYTAAKNTGKAYHRFRRSAIVERIDKVLRSQFNSYGKRKYTRRSHDILCECSWNPECNPSIRKFYQFMIDNTK